MSMKLKRKTLVVALMAAIGTAEAKPEKNIALEQIGRYTTGAFAEGAAEIVAYDAMSRMLFVINSDAATVDMLDISDPTVPALVGQIDVAVDLPLSGGVNSVAVAKGLVAIAIENADRQANGWIAFYDTAGNYLNHFMAGALPDMVTFTHNRQFALSANEGEPSGDYLDDPEGSITVVDLRKGVLNATAQTAGFSAFNGGAFEGVRISGPGATVAQDLEPEYIATSHDSSTAWVTLQENNALAIVDIRKAKVTDLVPLGSKDHSLPGNGLDASNSDGAINIQNWPVLGMYMPDAIAAWRSKGKTYLVTANEGDAREYFFDVADEQACIDAGGLDFDEDDGCLSWSDVARMRNLTLDPTAFPAAATLRDNTRLGRLNLVTTEGDTDSDSDYDEMHAFGARSITIWNAAGGLVADTGDTMEQVTALALPDDFNSTNSANDSFDSRSDDKGPEPEGVTIGKVRGRDYVFVGLERIGGIMIFDVSDPAEPRYVSYTNNRDFSIADVEAVDAGDLGPEGLLFIEPKDSPNGDPLLVVGNEVSGSTTIFRIVED